MKHLDDISRKEQKKYELALRNTEAIVKKRRALIEMATGRSAQNLIDEVEY